MGLAPRDYVHVALKIVEPANVDTMNTSIIRTVHYNEYTEIRASRTVLLDPGLTLCHSQSH